MTIEKVICEVKIKLVVDPITVGKLRDITQLTMIFNSHGPAGRQLMLPKIERLYLIVVPDYSPTT